jgi:hypothetical protein
MLVEGLLEIARGEGAQGKPVRPADQIRAYELLLAYGWGKPATLAPIDGADPLEADEIAAEIQRIRDELEAKREARQKSAYESCETQQSRASNGGRSQA